MKQHVNIIIPDFFELDGLEVHAVTFDQEVPNLALVIVGDNLNGLSHYNPVVRYYLADQKESGFKVSKEVDAFTFANREEALAFIEQSKKDSIYKLLKLSPENQLIFT